jgi:hypothetical protein
MHRILKPDIEHQNLKLISAWSTTLNYDVSNFAILLLIIRTCFQAKAKRWRNGKHTFFRKKGTRFAY